MLELHELQVFLVAAETENFSEAGRILQISQPAVSSHIHTLEERLKTQLFERTGRNIRLNEVGEALVPLVRNLLKEARRVEEFVALKQGAVIGKLTVGCSTAAGKYILPKIMSRFLVLYPEVQITCQVGPREQALEYLCSNEVDLAVSSLRIPRRDVEYRHFCDDRLVLIAPPDHPWARASRITPEELTGYPVIVREAGSGTAITLNRELMNCDMSLDMLQCRLTLWSSEAIVQAVIEGIGPAFVSQVCAAPAVSQGVVAEVVIEGFRLVQRLYMARHTGFHATEAQTAFWNFTFAPENEDLRPFCT